MISEDLVGIGTFISNIIYSIAVLVFSDDEAAWTAALLFARKYEIDSSTQYLVQSTNFG